VSDEDGVRYSLETAAFYGTAARVADQVAELHAAGAHHVLCQLSTGYLPHLAIMESMRRFGEGVIPRFR
jgi:alkanesulfonate monooxygenase SsuD/methylene tetrahydromethanopterin reductase-like flavin-dependent oxidoreductase (luciferase family)